MDESTMICESVWDKAPSRVVFKDHDEWGAYVPERACVLTHATGGGEFCSHCGVYVSGRAMADAIDWLSVNYCPNCGAEIVDDRQA